MTKNDLVFVPHNDINGDKISLVEQHNNLIETKNYSSATALLDNNNISEGVRALFLNKLQNKIRTIQLYLLNEFVANDDEYFSDTEPDTTFMVENGYTHWLKPY